MLREQIDRIAAGVATPSQPPLFRGRSSLRRFICAGHKRAEVGRAPPLKAEEDQGGVTTPTTSARCMARSDRVRSSGPLTEGSVLPQAVLHEPGDARGVIGRIVGRCLAVEDLRLAEENHRGIVERRPGTAPPLPWRRAP